MIAIAQGIERLQAAMCHATGQGEAYRREEFPIGKRAADLVLLSAAKGLALQHRIPRFFAALRMTEKRRNS